MNCSLSSCFWLREPLDKMVNQGGMVRRELMDFQYEYAQRVIKQMKILILWIVRVGMAHTALRVKWLV